MPAFITSTARLARDPELRETAISWIGQADEDRAADFLAELRGEW